MLTATAPPKRSSQLPQESAVPVPMLGERQEQFFDRAMRALKSMEPSINRRTVEVLKIWCASVNDQDLRDKAYLQFPEDKFVHYGPRCVFLEHTVPASADGSREEIAYDRTALQHLVNWANYRIRNSDNFAAISDGHTPTAQEKAGGHQMPEVLGYSGPFYLGLLGDIDPKWAIYADEWIHNEDIARFNKLQRRSPEVWVNDPIEQRTMDPIAALGAETPRLDSGMNPYCRLDNGRDVCREVAQSDDIVRYSAAAFPGANNSYIPDSERGRKPKPKRYGAAAMPNPEMGGQNEMSIGEAVASVMEELMPTIVQAVEQKMSGGSEDIETEEPMNGPQPGENEPVPMPPGTQPENAATIPRGEDNLDEGEESLDEEPVAQPNPKAPGEDEEARYKAQGPAIHGAYCAGKKSVMSYSRGSSYDPSLLKRVAVLETENRSMKRDLANERQDAMRYAKLVPLAQEFDFDPADEMKTVIDMSDAQFERHCDVTVKRYARRDDVTNLQIFDDPTVEVDQYARGGGKNEPTVEECHRYSMMAADAAARKNAAGERTDWQKEYDALVSKKYPNAVAS